MIQKNQILQFIAPSVIVLVLLLSSCQPAATPVPIQPTDPPTEQLPTANPVSHTTTQKPDAIQSLNDRLLLSSSSGSVIWQDPSLTLAEPNRGVVSWLPLNVTANNFVLHTEFSWDSGDTDETACGVAFRDNSQGDFYMSLVRRNGAGLLWLSLANQWQDSPAESNGNYVNAGNNETNDLILIAENEHITLIVNDTVFYQASDRSLNSGSISFVTGTALDGNTCTFTNSWIWEIGDEPSSAQQVRQVPNPSEPEHDIYAGFTDNSDIPILAVHKSGEKLGVASDESVVWSSPAGEAIVIFPNRNNFPKSAIAGQYVIHYTNYTNSTVDITIILPDGHREVFRTKLTADLSQRIASRSGSPYHEVKYTMPKSVRPQLQDVLEKIDNAMFDLDTATCAFKLVQAGGNPAIAEVLKIFDESCRGAFIELKIREGKAQNMDVTNLEGLQVGLDTVGCVSGRSFDNFKDCVSVLVTAMQTLRVEALNTDENVPPPPPDPKRKQRY